MINFIAVDNDKKILKIIEDGVAIACQFKRIKFKVSLFEEYDNDFYTEIQKPCVGNKVYIFDIETPHANGQEVLRNIRKKDKDSIAILISGFEETYATRIIKDTLNVLTFISKKDQFKDEIIHKVCTAIEYVKEDCYLEFQDSYKEYRLRKDEIIYIKAELRKAKICMKYGEPIYVGKTLRFFEEELGSNFIYSHRSCIVNSKMIQTIDKSKKIIIFKNGMTTDYLSKNFLKFYNMV